jgi:hypothetical protein
LSTDQKGAIAESAIAHHAIRRGIGVFRPLGEGERYDLIFDLRPGLVRIQCKWASLDGDVISVRCQSSRRTAVGIANRRYNPEEIDAFAAYCPELDECFFLPLDQFENVRAIQLRVNPCRNNQLAGVNWMKDFRFEATLPNRLGP